MNRHYDADGGGYYLSADDTSDLIMRPLSASDDAVPNANATMLQNLADLYTLTGDTAYLKRADAASRRISGRRANDGNCLYRTFIRRADANRPASYRDRWRPLRPRGRRMGKALSKVSLPTLSSNGLVMAATFRLHRPRRAKALSAARSPPMSALASTAPFLSRNRTSLSKRSSKSDTRPCKCQRPGFRAFREQTDRRMHRPPGTFGLH